MDRHKRRISIVIMCTVFGFFFMFKLSSASVFGIGAIFAFILPPVLTQEMKELSKYILPIAIVGIGAGIKAEVFLQVAPLTLIFVMGAIVCVLLLGRWLKRRFRLKGDCSVLITIGTAICGATAIATVAPIIKPKEKELVMALSTIFSLNALALILFPMIGGWLNLSQSQFGTWAAIAIHDTSSVVGASLAYGPEAFQLAVILKLVRATAIIPLALILVTKYKSEETDSVTMQAPAMFTGLFLLAGLVAIFPQHSILWGEVSSLAKTALLVVIFIMGVQCRVLSDVKSAAKPLAFGTLLWVVTSGVSLFLAMV